MADVADAREADDLGMDTDRALITYVNANSIPVLVDFARDRVTAARFNVEEWEVGLRADRPWGWYPRTVLGTTYPASDMFKLLHAENKGRM